MTINIVPSTTVLSVDNGAVIWILLSLDNLDFIAIKILEPTAKDPLKSKLINKSLITCKGSVEHNISQAV